MRLWLLLLLFALVGCAASQVVKTTTSDQSNGWSVDPDTHVLVHNSSGYQFPDDYPNCSRTDPRVYDQEGENVSVGYLCEELGAIIDIYVYPKQEKGRRALTNHFKEVLSKVIDKNRAELHTTRAGTLGVGNDKLLGYAGLLTWQHSGNDVGSHVLLFADPHARYVKVRATAAFSRSASELVPPLLVSKTILHRLAGAELTPRDLWPEKSEPASDETRRIPQVPAADITLTSL